MKTPHQWNVTSYEKIKESPKSWGISEAAHRQFKKTRWIVTEKIHGANLCFLTDGVEILAAKRKQKIEPNDPFFGYQRVLSRLRAPILQAFALQKAKQPQLTCLLIYGELFGGNYPHPKVPSVPEVQAIQTGVDYAPDIEFCAFDIAVEEHHAPTRDYLNLSEAKELADAANLPFTPFLFIGTYEEALAFPHEFPSQIPHYLGLPRLEENQAEGIVIKPETPLLIQGKKGKFRPVLKHKTRAFSEDQRYHQAQKWMPGSPSTPEKESLSLEERALGLINENRLNSVLSKMGRVHKNDPKKRKQLTRAFIQDIWDELEEQIPTTLQTLNKKERQQLQQVFQTHTETLLQNTLSSPGRRMKTQIF